MSAKLPFIYANPHLAVAPGFVRDLFIVNTDGWIETNAPTLGTQVVK
jgi:hypothetical protein